MRGAGLASMSASFFCAANKIDACMSDIKTLKFRTGKEMEAQGEPSVFPRISASGLHAMSVVIAGAGIAGLATGILLSRIGHDVRIIEQKADVGSVSGGGGRTITLALSARGFATLSAIGIDTAQLRHLPMRGRMVHVGDVAEFSRYDVSAADSAAARAIYAVRRADLHRILVAAAMVQPRLTIDWGKRCLGAAPGRLDIQATDGRTQAIGFDALIAADGANSPLRRQASRGAEGDARLLSHMYRELRVGPDIFPALRRDALHVWPAGDVMLVALPDEDGGFCATLFLPAPAPGAPPPDGDRLKAILQSRFPDVPNWLFPGFDRQSWDGGASPILTVSCPSWRFLPNALLIGDAAHAMAPFYGQGMNCALEDALVLARIACDAGDWTRCFSDYEASRRADVDAICTLSRDNYDNMSTPNPHAMPWAAHHSLYESIAFTCIPYAEAVALARQMALQALVSRQLVPCAERIAQ